MPPPGDRFVDSDSPWLEVLASTVSQSRAFVDAVDSYMAKVGTRGKIDQEVLYQFRLRAQ